MDELKEIVTAKPMRSRRNIRRAVPVSKCPRISITLEPSLYTRLKWYAAENRKSLQELLHTGADLVIKA